MMTTDPAAANRAFWDSVTPVHVRSAFYDVEGFVAGRSTLSQLERDSLGDVRGKRVAHLQCHFGLDTLSIARLGADVVGVDLSEPAIAAARAIADRAGLGARARFVQSDVLTLDLGETFDVILVNVGALCWLSDIARWAEVVATHLAPSGHLFLVECHPMAVTLAETDQGLIVRYPYQSDGAPTVCGPTPDYADPSHVHDGETHEWQWSLAEVTAALRGVGLAAQELGEHPFTVFRMFSFLEERGDGLYHSPADRPRIPLLYSLRARR